MKRIVIALAAAALLAWIPASFAATVTSSFVNFQYTYTVTPAAGEVVRDFHVAGEYAPSHYLNVTNPAGWNFVVHQVDGTGWISWWTTGDPLPVGAPATFGYKHYCAPCCHTWVVTNSGTEDPRLGQFDGSYNHLDEPCNIPAQYYPCPENDGGLVVAPIFPTPTPIDGSTWGNVKAMYK